MKKLLIFNSGSFIYGAERGLLNLLEAVKSEFLVTVVLPKKGPLFEEIKKLSPSVDIKIFSQPMLSLSFSPFYYLNFLILFVVNIIYFLFFIQEEEIDIICSNSLLLIAPAIISKFARKKYIWYLREFFPYQSINYILGKFVKIFSNAIICQSKTIRKRLFLFQDTQVIYEPLNPCNYKKYNQVQAKKDLGIPERTTVISIISRIHPSKGQLEFLHEIKKTLEEAKDVILLIIGDITTSNLKDILYRRRIYNFMENNKSENINILGFRKDIDRILSASDICVFPFKRIEPFGIIVTEALMFGKLTFYPRQGGLSEVYQIFKEGNSIDIESIREAISTRDKPINIAFDFFIPGELLFDAYRKKIYHLFSTK